MSSRRRTFFAYISAFAIGVMLFTFQNCGAIKRPAVDSVEFASTAFSHSGQEKSCSECHTRPTDKNSFLSVNNYAPFDYNTHGAKLDCISCHDGMAEGFRAADDWDKNAYYLHAANLNTCNECHTSQRPLKLAGGGNHPATGDCFSCHSGSLSLVQDKPASFAAAMDVTSMWKTAGQKPNLLTNDPATDADVSIFTASYLSNGSFSGWVQPSPTLQKVKMPMNHQAVVVGVDMDSCFTCHDNGSNYTGGRFHGRILNQPTACLDCHSESVPKPISTNYTESFVGPVAGLNVTTNPSKFNHASLAGKAECSACHRSTDWSAPKFKNAFFHKGTGAAPATCNECHKPSRPSGVTAAGFDHVAMGAMGECAVCHDAALNATKTKTAYSNVSTSKLTVTDWKGANRTPAGMAGTKNLAVQSIKLNSNAGVIVSKTLSTQNFLLQINHASFQTNCIACHKEGEDPKLGVFHSVQTNQPATCKECHTSALSGYVLGGATKPLDHAHSSVGSRDCASCHAAPNAANLGINFKDGVYHSKLASAPLSCKECHSGKILDQPIWKNKDHSTIGATDCISCHSATGLNGTINNPNWLGAKGFADNYTIPSHLVGTTNVSGFTAKHTTTNTNCTSCHGASTDMRTIASFDHQNLTADNDSCLSCHLGSKTSVGAYIQSTSRILMMNPTNSDEHHNMTLFVQKGVSCIGCHTSSLGVNTFNSVNGVVFPSKARQAYVNIGCGSVNGTTYSCHKSGQRSMVIPVIPSGTAGRWK